MKRKVATSLIILSLIGLTVPLIGCGDQISGQVEDKDSGPFYDDRVVTVRIVMPEDDWEFMQENAMSEQYARADLWYDGELIPDVAVRPKGNSSLREAASTGTARFSLKVDLNFFNSARNLDGVKKLNFNNGFSDPTLIRETLGYELFEQMGIPTPCTSFVDLWVNDTHLGLYTMVEQIDKTFLSDHFADSTGNLYKPEMSAGPLSWTEADLEAQQPEESGVNDNLDVNLGGGKLREIMEALEEKELTEEGVAVPEGTQMPPRDVFPGDMPQGDKPPLMDLAIAAAKLGVTEQQLREALGDPSQGPPDLAAAAQQLNVSEESLQEALGLPAEGMMPPPGMPPGGVGDYLQLMGLKTNENNPNHSALFHFLDILNNEPDETFPEEIEKVLDVDEVLRFLAVSTLIVHLDNYIGSGHNYYLYETDGKFTIIPWDLNMAFGTFNCFSLDRESLINYHIDEPTCEPISERPLVERLLSHGPYLDAYHGYLKSLLNEPFDADRMFSRIDELADLIRPYVQSDQVKFFSTQDFEHGLTQDVNVGMAREGMPGPLPNPIGLKTFVVERSESVRQQLEGKRPSAGNGSGNGGGVRMFRRPNQAQGRVVPQR